MAAEISEKPELTFEGRSQACIVLRDHKLTSASADWLGVTKAVFEWAESYDSKASNSQIKPDDG